MKTVHTEVIDNKSNCATVLTTINTQWANNSSLLTSTTDGNSWLIIMATVSPSKYDSGSLWSFPKKMINSSMNDEFTDISTNEKSHCMERAMMKIQREDEDIDPHYNDASQMKGFDQELYLSPRRLLRDEYFSLNISCRGLLLLLILLVGVIAATWLHLTSGRIYFAPAIVQYREHRYEIGNLTPQLKEIESTLSRYYHAFISCYGSIINNRERKKYMQKKVANVRKSTCKTS